jgi:hypothetical protein
MALTGTLVIVELVVPARHIAVAISMMLSRALLADVFRFTAHEGIR